jgi:hypothetical protein
MASEPAKPCPSAYHGTGCALPEGHAEPHRAPGAMWMSMVEDGARPAQAQLEPPRKRQRRPAELFDRDGNPVIVRYPCTECGRMKPVAAFGIRKMNRGELRANTICGPCRGAYQAKRPAVPSPANPTTPPAEATSPASANPDRS